MDLQVYYLKWQRTAFNKKIMLSVDVDANIVCVPGVNEPLQ